MAETGNGLKQIFLRGVEAVGKKAASLAERAGERLREINAQRQMDEVRRQVVDAAKEAFAMGQPLPEKLTFLLSELNRLTEACQTEEDMGKAEKTENKETSDTAVEEELPDAGNEN